MRDHVSECLYVWVQTTPSEKTRANIDWQSDEWPKPRGLITAGPISRALTKVGSNGVQCQRRLGPELTVKQPTTPS